MGAILPRLLPFVLKLQIPAEKICANLYFGSLLAIFKTNCGGLFEDAHYRYADIKCFPVKAQTHVVLQLSWCQS